MCLCLRGEVRGTSDRAPCRRGVTGFSRFPRDEGDRNNPTLWLYPRVKCGLRESNGLCRRWGKCRNPPTDR